MIPQDDHPEINFVGLLIGPRGNTLKTLEKEVRHVKHLTLYSRIDMKLVALSFALRTNLVMVFVDWCQNYNQRQGVCKRRQDR